MMSKMKTNVRYVRCPKCRQVLPEPEVPMYRCGGCGTVLQAKKPKKGMVDATSGRVEEGSSGKRKMEQVSGDQVPGRSSNQQLPVNSTGDHNEPRSSTELSSHEDPESSPEATTHNRMDQDQEDDHQDRDREDDHQDQDREDDHRDQDEDMFMGSGVLEKHENGGEFEESSRELTASSEKCSSSELNEIEEPSNEAVANTEIVNGGSKSSFKSLIAEKLLDTRHKKVANTEIVKDFNDEDDALSEDDTADLRHRTRFKRVSSGETSGFGGPGYYGYDGSVSSFDGNDDHRHRESHARWRHEFCPSNASPSRLRFNKYREDSRHRSPIIPENPKLEKLELLKMVRELQDRLEISNVRPYYDHIPNHPGRFRQRMAFSGETTSANRNLDGGPCHHCCPPDRHFSAQLPQQLVCCHGPHFVPAACYNPHYSGPSSPHHHLGTKPKPDNMRKQYHSPKKKRHLRPIAGGAPLITCYKCSKLLQLPQSFLVFKKRCHRLRCGACFTALSFTLSSGTHVTRYYPEETIAAPPCSEVEEYAESIGYQPGPVSCSDRSFQKSYSTETEKRGSVELVEERKRLTRSKGGLSGSSGPSFKILGRKNTTSEIEEIEPATSGSPLHRLMGYASPSKVIRG